MGLSAFEKAVLSATALVILAQVGMWMGVASGLKQVGETMTATLQTEFDKATIWDLFLDQTQDHSLESWKNWVKDTLPDVDTVPDEIDSWWDEMNLWNPFGAWDDED
jgi:hypothetical protein